MKSFSLIAAILFFSACHTPTPRGPKLAQGPKEVSIITVPAEVSALVLSAERSETDRALDGGRQPEKMLAFYGIKPGMKVAELGVGGGYTAELLARAVGAAGVVYGQNSKYLLERFAEKPWSERLQKPVMSNVIRVDREFGDPLPPEVKNLDAVFMVLFYHDTAWMEVDRAQMNQRIFAALKPGGTYAIIDHSAKEGAGINEVKTLHRIEEKALVEEVIAAGFRLEETATFLRSPADTLDWNASPGAAAERRGTSDRFALKFVKP
jgi:predicted methyltransferase